MIRVAHPPGYAAERRYAADVLLGELLGLETELVVEQRDDVELTIPGESGSLRLPDRLFATPEADWLTPASLPPSPVPREEGLPLVYGRDLLGGAFFLLTRYEEAVRPERDGHGRFPADVSLAAREGFLDRPLVNEYAELLWSELRAGWPRLERAERRFRLLPSHDVDLPFCRPPGIARRLRGVAGDVVRRRDLALALRRLGGRSDLCDTFDFLMDESERNGLRSAFFFIAAPAPEDRVGDGYALDEPRVRRLLRRIHERGHELGLHGSYASLDDPARLETELQTLRRACAAQGIDQEIRGGRQHYLRWSAPLWRAYESAGLHYDTSLAFPEQPGFRAGICCEYPVFDLRGRQTLRLRERPLVAMEASLLQYQGLDEDATLERLLELKRTCRRFGGDFTLLWHNNRLESRRARRVYCDVLAG